MPQKIGEENDRYSNANHKIIVAFFSLLKNNSFERITTSQIILEAHINRSTFYRHFKDKNEILESIQSSIIPYFFNKIIMQNVNSPSEYIRLIFSLIKNMPEEYFERFLRLSLIKTSTFDIKECITQKMAKDYQTLCTDASTIESQIFAIIAYDTIYHNSKHDNHIDEKQLQKYLKNIVKNI